MNNYRMGTKCAGWLYTGQRRTKTGPDHPVHDLQISTSGDMGKLFDLEAEGYFYTGLQNPTNRPCGSEDRSDGRRYGSDADLQRPGGKLLCHV